jgi:uncharacterized protein YdcH (DUF465 family)
MRMVGDEFPDQASLIGRLTKTNYEFGRLAAAYGEVNRQIRRIETKDEPTSDEDLYSPQVRSFRTQIEEPNHDPREPLIGGLV